MLASVIELADRLPFTMNADEEREAEGALEDLSFDAQSIGTRTWTVESVPPSVKNLILRAAARHMKNYEGYTSSRAGDESVQWAEQDAPGTATFTKDEKRALAAMAGRGGFIGTVGVVGWGAADRPLTGYVPASSGSAFPLFADPQEPW